LLQFISNTLFRLSPVASLSKTRSNASGGNPRKRNAKPGDGFASKPIDSLNSSPFSRTRQKQNSRSRQSVNSLEGNQSSSSTFPSGGRNLRSEAFLEKEIKTNMEPKVEKLQAKSEADVTASNAQLNPAGHANRKNSMAPLPGNLDDDDEICFLGENKVNYDDTKKSTSLANTTSTGQAGEGDDGFLEGKKPGPGHHVSSMNEFKSTEQLTKPDFSGKHLDNPAQSNHSDSRARPKAHLDHDDIHITSENPVAKISPASNKTPFQKLSTYADDNQDELAVNGTAPKPSVKEMMQPKLEQTAKKSKSVWRPLHEVNSTPEMDELQGPVENAINGSKSKLKATSPDVFELLDSDGDMSKKTKAKQSNPRLPDSLKPLDVQKYPLSTFVFTSKQDHKLIRGSGIHLLVGSDATGKSQYAILDRDGAQVYDIFMTKFKKVIHSQDQACLVILEGDTIDQITTTMAFKFHQDLDAKAFVDHLQHCTMQSQSGFG
jgi:hypothetical protein